MDDVGFGKDCTSAGKARHAFGARDHGGEVLDTHAQAAHLVFEERAGAGGAALVHRKLRRAASLEADEARILGTYFHDRASLRYERRRATNDGGHVLELTRSRLQPSDRRGTYARHRHGLAALRTQGRSRIEQQLMEGAKRIALVDPAGSPDGLGLPVEQHRRNLHGTRPHVDTEGVGEGGLVCCSGCCRGRRLARGPACRSGCCLGRRPAGRLHQARRLSRRLTLHYRKRRLARYLSRCPRQVFHWRALRPVQHPTGPGDRTCRPRIRRETPPCRAS